MMNNPFLFTSNILTFNTSQIHDTIELEEITFKIPTSYKYNTVCDLYGLPDGGTIFVLLAWYG